MPARYGVTIRRRLATVLKQQRTAYACPNCGKKQLRRLANALWRCRNCDYTFAGGAYAPETAVGATAKKLTA